MAQASKSSIDDEEDDDHSIFLPWQELLLSIDDHSSDVFLSQDAFLHRSPQVFPSPTLFHIATQLSERWHTPSPIKKANLN
jgi:hypothetical protein